MANQQLIQPTPPSVSDEVIDNVRRGTNQLHLNDVMKRANARHQQLYGKPLNPGQVALASKDYRRYLMLRLAYPGVTLVPTRLIDLVWETHILDTRQYVQDCAIINKVARTTVPYIHHDPHILPGTPEHADGVRIRDELFRRHFNMLPTRHEDILQDYSDGETCA